MKYANNKKIWFNLRDEFPFPFLKQHAVRAIEKFPNSNDLLDLAIASDSEAIESIGVHFNNDIKRKSAVLSYWFAEPFWGYGIATNAINKIAITFFQILILLEFMKSIREKYWGTTCFRKGRIQPRKLL